MITEGALKMMHTHSYTQCWIFWGSNDIICTYIALQDCKCGWWKTIFSYTHFLSPLHQRVYLQMLHFSTHQTSAKYPMHTVCTTNLSFSYLRWNACDQARCLFAIITHGLVLKSVLCFIDSSLFDLRWYWNKTDWTKENPMDCLPDFLKIWQ